MKFAPLCATVLLAAVAAPALAQNAPTSVWDGVYTDEQADRGSGVYTAQCAPCHGPSPWVEKFADQPLSEFYAYIRANMPDGAPGSLPPEDYSAAAAYLLRSEGFPAGEKPLPTLSRSMTGIMLTYTKDGADGEEEPEPAAPGAHDALLDEH